MKVSSIVAKMKVSSIVTNDEVTKNEGLQQND